MGLACPTRVQAARVCHFRQWGTKVSWPGGGFHSVSRKHLPNYLGEFEFRWNTRKLNDGERVSRAIRQVDGKRLQYRESVDNPPYFVPAAPKQAWAHCDWRANYRKPEQPE